MYNDSITIEEASNWATDSLPTILLAIAIVAASFVVGKLLKKAIIHGLGKATQSQGAVQLLGTTSYVVVILVGLMVALNVLNLDGAATSMLAGAGVVGIAIGFAFQDIAANVISGVFIAFQRPMRVGDLVKTGDFYGTVKSVSLRMTTIETLLGQRVHIPNKDILLNPLVEFNALNQRRVDVRVGVGYGTDLQHTQQLLIEALKKLPAVETKRPIECFYEEFGDSSINLWVRFWCSFKKEPDYLSAKSEAIITIKQTLDKAGVNIPFPIRTLQGAVSVNK